MRVLLIEDDRKAAKLLAKGLQEEGFVVDVEPTSKEFAILEVLMRSAGEIVSRTRLIERVWDEASEILDNLVDVHLSHLRKKIDRGESSTLIHTVRGFGYRLGPFPSPDA